MERKSRRWNSSSGRRALRDSLHPAHNKLERIPMPQKRKSRMRPRLKRTKPRKKSSLQSAENRTTNTGGEHSATEDINRLAPLIRAKNDLADPGLQKQAREIFGH